MHLIGRNTRDASLTESHKSRILHAKAESVTRAPYERIRARECHLRNNVLSNKTRLPPPLPQSTFVYPRLTVDCQWKGTKGRERERESEREKMSVISREFSSATRYLDRLYSVVAMTDYRNLITLDSSRSESICILLSVICQWLS